MPTPSDRPYSRYTYPRRWGIDIFAVLLADHHQLPRFTHARGTRCLHLAWRSNNAQRYDIFLDVLAPQDSFDALQPKHLDVDHPRDRKQIATRNQAPTPSTRAAMYS